MLAVVCEEPGVLRNEQRPMPEAGPGEVLLRVRRVGVCGTDLHIFGGRQPYLRYPRVMGHEFSAEVVSAEAGTGLVPGDAVYVMPYLSCGRCIACRKGKTNCCVAIQVLGVHRDGAFTEYLSVPAGFVRKVDGVGLDEAAMVEFLAIGAHAARRAAVASGERVLVTGAGPIGIAAALFSRLRGAAVTVLDSRTDRLDVCRQALGVQATVTVGPGDAAELSRLTDGEFFDVVFDATGNAEAMERGLNFVAHGGRYGLISIVQATLRFSDPEFHKRETTLLACRNATIEDFETVLAAMRAGQVPTRALATHRLALSEVADRFTDLLNPAAGVIKAIVEC